MTFYNLPFASPKVGCRHSRLLLARVLAAPVIAASLIFTTTTARSQEPGSLDLSFETGSLVDGTVHTVVPAADGKIYIGGDFTSVRGAARRGLARLNADGTVDETFDSGTAAGSYVRVLAVQPDGKLLVGGGGGIKRLNHDGSQDSSFVRAANSYVFSLALQADGKVIIGGSFTYVGETARNYIARLNSDGTLDATFNPGSGANGTVLSLALQPDGRVIIAGWFTSFNGTSRNHVARLNSNGSLHSSFNPGSGADSNILSLVLQSDGKVIIAGNFNNYNGTARRCIARLNSNGSLDSAFNPGSGANNSVRALALRADGKVVIGGSFTSFNGTERIRVALLNTNGSLDAAFNPGSGADNSVYSLALQTDGKVMAGGDFSRYRDAPRSHIARLNEDGTLDTGFDPDTGADNRVYSIALQPDGKVLIGGEFVSYMDVPRHHIARLHEDGSLDDEFDPGAGANNTVYCCAVQEDDKVLIGGDFTSYGGIARHRITRLNNNGSLDATFEPGGGASHPVRAIAPQPDGKIVIGGNFNTYNGVARNGIARLNADGSLDSSFNPGTGATGVVTLAIQPNGKILIAGSFVSYNGAARYRVARLNSDGSLDNGFDPGSGASFSVGALALQLDGRVFIGGSFTTYNGISRRNLARLNPDGSLDTSFDPGFGPNSSVNSLTVQADGKLLIGGSFVGFDGISCNRVARISSDGNLDTSFSSGTGANSTVSAIAVQAEGKVIMGGSFSTFNGNPRPFLARVWNDPAVQTLSATSRERVEWLRGSSAPEVEQVTFENSPDGVTWSTLGAGSRTTGGWEMTGLGLSASGQLRARGRATGGSGNGSSSIIEQTVVYEITAVPQISVLDITDSPEMELFNDTTSPVNFGSHPVPILGGVMRSFTVKNTGNAPLSISTISVTPMGTFELMSPPPGSLAPDESFSFSIRFSANDAGTYQGNVSILSNSPDHPTFAFPLTATGLDSTPPFIQVSMIGGSVSPGGPSGTIYAKAGANIYLYISSNEPISEPTVLICSRTVTATDSGSGNGWNASIVVDETFPQGPAGISVTATDLAGNTANPVTFPSFSFPIMVDTVAPTLSGRSMWSSNPTTGWAKTGDTVFVSIYMSEEIVNPMFTIFGTTWMGSVMNSYFSGISITSNPITTEPEGPVAVSFQCTDRAGNAGTFDTISFDPQVVVDRTPPVITQATLKVEATAPGGANAIFTPPAADVLGSIASVSSTPASGSFFALGSTPVTVSATDSAGNSGIGGFSLTVLEAGDFWRDLYFDQTANSGDAADTADPDKDGVVNLLERAFNMHPLQPGRAVLTAGTGTAGLPLVTVQGEGDDKRLRTEYLRRKAASFPGFTYEAQFSPALTAGWSPAVGESVISIDDLWERVIVEDSPGASRSFGRVQLTAP